MDPADEGGIDVETRFAYGASDLASDDVVGLAIGWDCDAEARNEDKVTRARGADVDPELVGEAAWEGLLEAGVVGEVVANYARPTDCAFLVGAPGNDRGSASGAQVIVQNEAGIAGSTDVLVGGISGTVGDELDLTEEVGVDVEPGVADGASHRVADDVVGLTVGRDNDAETVDENRSAYAAGANIDPRSER